MTDLLPRYDSDALHQVVPSLLAATGTPGFTDALGVGPARAAVLLLVDGLGWEALQAHRDDAPFLAGLAGRPLSVGFPSSTAVSITSVGTGLTPGEHGVVGYTVAAPGGGLLNSLRWQVDGVDARETLRPEEWQPESTAFERATAAGRRVTVAAPGFHRGSGLTRAALRGGRFRPVVAPGDLLAAVVEGTAPAGALCYAYIAELDTVGHVHGPGSLPWRVQLRLVDTLVRGLAEALPDGTLLAVTADHGMVQVDDRLDLDERPDLLAGVRLVAGEPRARHVHVHDGALADVAAAWRETLGERAAVVEGERALDEGWFGPRVDARVRSRVGDLVVAARSGLAVVRTQAEPKESRLVGHHGSLSATELFVPLLTVAAT